MSIYLEKYYHIDKDGKEDILCSSLDCWDQFLYFILREKSADCKYAFCDDINISFFPQLKEAGCISLKMYNDIFLVNQYDMSDDPEKIIANILAEENIAIISTYFNLLEPYGWYDIDSKEPHINHYMGVIGCDKNDYFFIDSPWVIHKEWNSVYDRKKSIFRLNKNKLLEVCKIYSQIRSVNLIDNWKEKINKVSEVIKIIKNNFYKEFIEDIGYIGYRALEELEEMVIQKGEENCTFFRDHFLSHLVYSKHLILKWCLEEAYNLKSSNTCIRYLDELISTWRRLVVFIAKNGKNTLQLYRNEIVCILNEVKILSKNFILALETIPL